MTEALKVTYATEALPTEVTKSVFLAGPTPRRPDVPSWRPDALKYLQDAGFDGHVFVPEHRDKTTRPDYTNQVQWETAALNAADIILFWIPRDMETMPALTTNHEFGIWSTLDPSRVFLGAPPDAAHVRYQQASAKELHIPSYDNLRQLTAAVTEHLGEGVARTGGETQVPLHIWNTPSFQSWYTAQKAAGNELHGANTKWVFRIGPKFVLYWALHVDMFVPGENRHKTNEVVISRPDVCLTVAWHRPPGASAEDTQFALIREYRTPAVSEDGFAWENPGGSSFKPDKDPAATAAAELKEELGLVVNPARVKSHGARQIAATLSAHRAHVYSVNLSAAEMSALAIMETTGQSYGNDCESERTYPRVRTLKQIQEGGFVDWTTIGILYSVLASE